MNNGSRQALVRATLRSCSDVAAAIIFPLLLASCANVTFHPGVPDGTPGGTTPDLSKQTGLKYYTAKPYLLVGPTGNKDAPLKTEIISLPDLEHPTYAIYHPGWGSHHFSLAVASNGNLSSYGQTADSKIPETIAALSGLVTAVRPPAAAPAPSAPASGKSLLQKSEAKESITKAIKQLQHIVHMAGDGTGLVESNKEQAKEFIAALESLTVGSTVPPIDQPDLETALSTISEGIKKAVIPDAAYVDAAVAINSYYNNAKNYVDAAIGALAAGAPAKPGFKLFEIQMKDGKTYLIPADCKLASHAMQQWGYSK